MFLRIFFCMSHNARVAKTQTAHEIADAPFALPHLSSTTRNLVSERDRKKRGSEVLLVSDEQI